VIAVRADGRKRQAARAIADMSFLGRSDVRHGQVPMSLQDFEAALFFFLIRGLIGIEFFDQGIFFGIGSGGDGRVFVDDRDTVVPPGIFSHVIGGRFDFEREDATGFFDFAQKREMVFQEEIEKFFLVPPASLVVELHDVGLVGGALRWRALGRNVRRKKYAESQP
jgi:hypothetical protein